MEEGSILGSLDRLEVAIARVEAAARQRQTPVNTAATHGPDEDLERRHAALRSVVEGALARLDAVIEVHSAVDEEIGLDQQSPVGEQA